MYNFKHGIESKFSCSIFGLKKSKKNLSFVMAKMHLKYTVFFVCCCFDSCRYQIHALWSVTHIRCLPASHVAIDFGKNAVTTHRHCCSQGMIKCWNINNEKKALVIKKFKVNNLIRGSNPYFFRPEVLSYHFLNQTCFCTVLAVFIACPPSHNSSFFVNSQELLSWQY